VGQVLDTEARREVQAATASSDEKFVAALKEQGWWALSAPWVEVQRPKHSEDETFNQVVEKTNEGEAILASRLNEVYRDFCSRHGLRAREAAQLGKTLKAELPGAYAKPKKLGPVPRQVWFGLPMMPPTMEADVIPLPLMPSPAANTGQIETSSIEAPASGKGPQARVPVDDGDFGAGAA